METKLKETEMERIKARSGFDCGVVVPCSGQGKDRAGGLALLWNDQVNFTLDSFSSNHISGAVLNDVNDESWFFSGVYGFPEEKNKKKMWSLIQHLASKVVSRWLCVGDLNDMLSGEDKKGGNSRTLSQLNLGRQTIEDCGLVDMGFEGYPFTWTNGREGEENIQCRLDRALATQSFMNRFSPTRVIHLPRYGSDHAALLVVLEAQHYSRRKKRVHLFRFEESWTKDTRCVDEVRRQWTNSRPHVEAKLGAMSALDKFFEEYRTGTIRKEITKIEKELKEDNMWNESDVGILNYKEKERQLADLLQAEETVWRQRSRAMWLKEGDKNTKFFHSKANQRKKVNEIKRLKDVHGCWWHGEENVERIFVDYFTEMFTSSDPIEVEKTCEVVAGKLNVDQVMWCSQPFSREEVEEAIYQMHPLKAPGPDGLPALFYQKYWNIVGTEVCKLVLDILNNSTSPKSVNNTFIVLIPKCKNPNSPKDFRPISLCNVIMKIVTKTIANRLKSILPDIIDE
ncbi:hypothetical protein QL285_033075 [Trifolium repens]|nr:hypothetical protein QL285_033075 [Trifolium repens]